MARALPNVFSLAPGREALSVVISALMSGALLGIAFRDAPERLADLVIHVPTKRLKGALEAALIRELGPRPVILPAIRPLGAPGDTLEQLETDALATLTSERRVISAQARRFELLPLVREWRGSLSEADAAISLREELALAGALGDLIDECARSGVPLVDLASAAPPNYDPSRFDDYWKFSREFLIIAARFWPARLEELKAQDAVAAQLERLRVEAARLKARDPSTPMLILGSTGSVAATGALMKVVARLDHGAVVLPGLDLDLDREVFALIGPQADAMARAKVSIATQFAHPQSMLSRTLREIDIPRDAVLRLPAGEPSARALALSDMLRPAETVSSWRQTQANLPTDAFEGISVIEAADEQEEALAIAIAMRETLQTPGRSVALVTPDRTLAKRVQIELARWGIKAADSAGQTLRESGAGVFLMALLGAGAGDTAALLSVLAHPLARFGFSREGLTERAQALELAVLRGHRFLHQQPLSQRVRHGLAALGPYAHPSVKRLAPETINALPEFAALIDAALAPLRPEAPAASLPEHAMALITMLEAATRDERGESHIADFVEGGALLALLHTLGAVHAPAPVSPAALPAALALLMGEQPLPPQGTEHPRALLLGPFEARLIEADRIILGMLNEGRFPPAAPEDPFLNRAMRMDLGLQPPEWRIGASAHDFAQLSANPDLLLTRAKRMGTAPALPSRFWRRFEAYAGKERWKDLRAKGEAYCDMARRIDAPSAPLPRVMQPAPVPQAPRVPKKLSITEIEKLARDPYALYAKYLLDLVPLEPPDPEIDARDRGTLLHSILELYAVHEPPLAYDDAYSHLITIAQQALEPLQGEPELYYFWRRQVETIAPGFIAFDRAARDAGHSICVEQRGGFEITLATGDIVRLSGKADRIERHPDGSIAVLDYKTGAVPSGPTILKGLAPQLPITAALVARGAFGPPGPVTGLAHASIGASAPFATTDIKTDDLNALIQAQWDSMVAHLEGLAAGTQGYTAQANPAKNSVGDYDHLSRRALWAMVNDDEEEA